MRAIDAGTGVLHRLAGSIVGRPFEGMATENGNRLTDQALNAPEQVTLGGIAERDRLAIHAGTRGAADAVDVGLGLFRQIVIHHERDTLDVDAASGDVGRDEDAAAARAEIFQRALTGVLALVAVDRLGGDAIAAQLLDDLVRHVLHADERDDEAFRMLLDEVGKSLRLVVASDEGDMLVDAFHRGRGGSHFDAGGVVDDRRGEFLDGRRHRGGEQKRLAARRQLGDDALDLMHEAEIEHAVRFVENENFDLVQGDMLLALEILQTARGGDENIDATVQSADLRHGAHATEDGGMGQAQVAAVRGEALADLGGEFARRGEDQGAGALRTSHGVGGGEALQNGEREGGRLAGAGLRHADEIATFEEVRNGLGLDGRGLGVVLLEQGAQKRLGKGELGEENGGGSGADARKYWSRSHSCVCAQRRRSWRTYRRHQAAMRMGR